MVKECVNEKVNADVFESIILLMLNENIYMNGLIDKSVKDTIGDSLVDKIVTI